MKKKLFLVCTLATLVVFSFAGCRDMNSASGTSSGAASSGMGINSMVSGAMSAVNSAVDSAASGLNSMVSGAMSAVNSDIASATASK